MGEQQQEQMFDRNSFETAKDKISNIHLGRLSGIGTETIKQTLLSCQYIN